MRPALASVGFAWMCCLAFVSADDVAPLRAFEKAVQTAIAKADPAIACILVSRQAQPISWQELISPDRVPEFFGSGTVIDHRLVLTCYHVVRDATMIAVKLPAIAGRRGIDGQVRFSQATIWAGDVRSDLAVLQLKEDHFATPPIEIGRGEDLAKGSLVVGLSHPFAVGFRDGSPSASSGIISNIRRRLPGSPREEDRHRSIHNYGSLLQTDARIQLGCSGGALLDLDGKLVGITTAQAALVGAETEGGLAIPVSAGIRRVIDVLRKGEEVEYGFLGVGTDPVFFGRRPDRGVYLNRVTANSPAERAGLKNGDQVTMIDGQPVRDYDDMFLHIGLGLADREITIHTLRNNRPMETKVRLAKFPFPNFGEAKNRPPMVHGMLVDHTSVVTRGNEPMPNGVVVRHVEKDSPADQQKLVEHADVITAVNGVRVQTPKEFYAEAEKATRNQQPIRLTLINPPRTVTLP